MSSVEHDAEVYNTMNSLM